MTKRVYRVRADFKVAAEFDVIAESEEEAKDLTASQSSDVHVKSVGYAIDAGEFDVDESSVTAEDLGEASDADIARPDKVMAIRP